MSTQDRFPTETTSSSLREPFVITPANDVELAVRPKGIYVSATCDLATKAHTASDPVVIYPQLAPGICHPISPGIVMATGTTGGVTIVGG